MPDSSSYQTPVLASVYPAWPVKKVFVSTAVFTGGTVTLASVLVNTTADADQARLSTQLLASAKKCQL